jgi:hypothetical protein
MVLQPSGPWLIFSFLIYAQSVGPLGWEMRPSQGHYLHTEQHKHRINAHRHPCLEWNSNLWFEWAKTVHALDRAAAVFAEFPTTEAYSNLDRTNVKYSTYKQFWEENLSVMERIRPNNFMHSENKKEKYL